MGRCGLEVRRVEGTLQAPFIDLWVAHRIESGTTPDAARRLAADGTLTGALDRSDIAAYLAYVDDSPVGYVVVADTTRSLLVDAPCVSITMLYVLPEYRRGGVAAALLATTARYAERVGAEHVASHVPAHDRETNRFFARLGFAPETVRRVTSVAMLQRRLAGPSPTRRSVAQVLQRRRDLRRTCEVAPPRVAG